MASFLLIGTALGFSAGISPGPLLTLVITESLAGRTAAGVKVAISPLITDGPIILVVFTLLMKFSGVSVLLGIISIAGAVYISLLGINSLRIAPMTTQEAGVSGRPLLKGALVNALNPHPYLFWLTVGWATIASASQHGTAAVVFFLSTFYLFLIGSKVVIALFVGHWRSLLSTRAYLLINRILGCVLLFFALWLLREGILLLAAPGRNL